MLFWQYVFYICIFIFLYNYFFYAIIAYLLAKLFPAKKTTDPVNYYPSISFIVAAYNEQEIIEKKNSEFTAAKLSVI